MFIEWFLNWLKTGFTGCHFPLTMGRSLVLTKMVGDIGWNNKN